MSGQTPIVDNHEQNNTNRPMNQEIRSSLGRLERHSLRKHNPKHSTEKSRIAEVILGNGDKKLILSVLNDSRTPAMLLSLWIIDGQRQPHSEWAKLLDVEDVETCLRAAVAAADFIAPARINRPRSGRQLPDEPEFFAFDDFGYISINTEFEEGVLLLKLKAHLIWKKAPVEIANICPEDLFNFIYGLQWAWYDLLEISGKGGAK